LEEEYERKRQGLWVENDVEKELKVEKDNQKRM
jgi:hypothetical protein